jgi:hypothetical protein
MQSALVRFGGLRLEFLAHVLVDGPKVVRVDAGQTFAKTAVVGVASGALEVGLFQQALGQIRMMEQAM